MGLTSFNGAEYSCALKHLKNCIVFYCSGESVVYALLSSATFLILLALLGGSVLRLIGDQGQANVTLPGGFYDRRPEVDNFHQRG